MTSKFLNISTDTTLGGSSASDNTVASQKAVKAYADTKQDTLVSGTNIKTVGGTSLLGSGNVAFPTVDQTYSATSANAQSGVAVANAIAPKQDTLVSGTNIKTINGNSLLGSGNITIETSSTPNVDGTTISYNSSDALQAIAVKNVRDGSTLPIWHGTEYQWNHGDPTTWYYWQTSVTALWTSGGTLPSSGYWPIPAYGDGKFVAVCSNSKNSAYSTDSGATWQSVTLPVYANWQTPAYGDGKFVIVGYGSTSSAYSTDGGATWQSATLPSSGYWEPPAYGDGKFVAVVQNSDATAIFTIQYDKCYTDTASPTTTSVVYSEPAVTSSYTISSVTSGAITLSNNNTYYYNQSGNTQTYQTIGDAHPEYLCFIDGVGVKMGNTMIATNNSNS